MLNRQDEADRTLFVGNLDCNVKEEILYELFLQAGPLTKVNIAKDKEGNFKSFGFVCFKHTESVPYAISLLNGIRLYGRPIKLDYRFGNSRSSESTSPLQSPENGFVANTPGSGMVRGGDNYPLSPSMAGIDHGYLSQAYLYFCSMMNPFLAFQNAAYGLMTQESPNYMPSLQWNKDSFFQAYEKSGSSSTAGPSSVNWGQTNPSNSKWCQRPEDTRKRKADTETRETSSDESVCSSNPPEQTPTSKKHNAKRRC
ncbi:splicing regulator RBM11 [Pelobates fuscus]|uniref:splicing regulator RBM11 n=1 Tax=Pelobates fuscus TaxID=191477 RepID=UPI002FE4E915